MYVCVHVCVYMCVCVCMYMCVCVCMGRYVSVTSTIVKCPVLTLYVEDGCYTNLSLLLLLLFL